MNLEGVDREIAYGVLVLSMACVGMFATAWKTFELIEWLAGGLLGKGWAPLWKRRMRDALRLFYVKGYEHGDAGLPCLADDEDFLS